MNPKVSQFSGKVGHSGHWCILWWLMLPWKHHAELDVAFSSSLRTLELFVISERPFLSALSGFRVIGKMFSRWRPRCLSCSPPPVAHHCDVWWAQRQTNYMTGTMSNIVGIPMRFAPPRGMPYALLRTYALCYPIPRPPTLVDRWSYAL